MKHKETIRKYNGTPVYDWELEIVKNWTLNEIRNRIWDERGENPVGYHNT